MPKPTLRLLVLLLALFLTACQATPSIAPVAAPAPSATAEPVESAASQASPTDLPPAESEPSEAVLEIVGVSETRSLSIDDLRGMAAKEGQAGIKSSTGKITLPASFTGVPLRDLAALVGGLDPSLSVNVVAKDGYGLTFSYDQMVNGTFIAYDPASGDELKSVDPLTAVIAYARDGQPMPEDSDGVLRVAIVSERNNQVTDGHWSIKWVSKLEVKPLAADWSLSLHGTLNEVVDRGNFESCVQCHKATWTDDKAQVWTGIPLWLLLGYVDDDSKHQDDAFNDEVSAYNYTINLKAADGYQVTLDSGLVGRNDSILAVSTVNDNPLPEKYFPVRIVSDGLDGDQQIGALVEIALQLEEVPADLFATGSPAAGDVQAMAATPGSGAPSSAAGWELKLHGTLNETLTNTDLDSCQKCHAVSWLDGDSQTWSGIPLWRLLGRVDDTLKHDGPAFNDAASAYNYYINIVAADGRTVTLDSGLVGRNDVILLATSVNGGPLPEKHMPLRVVGEPLAKEQQLGAVQEIVLTLQGVPSALMSPPAAETATAPAAVEGAAAPVGDLVVVGLVKTPLGLSEADLRAMEVVKLTLEHPKKGSVEYEGVRLAGLLEKASPGSGASKVVFTADDGFSAEADLTEVQRCADCLVAFGEAQGKFNLAMPGMASSIWVKNVVSVELK